MFFNIFVTSVDLTKTMIQCLHLLFKLGSPKTSKGHDLEVQLIKLFYLHPEI